MAAAFGWASAGLAEGLRMSRPDEMALNRQYVTDLLVEAIVQVESSGNPGCIGQAGERGLMQIKQATWNETTGRLYGRSLSFQQAFDGTLNRKVGRAYLARLYRFIHRHRAAWRSDERALLLAAYNAGPTRLRAARFDLRRLPPTTQDYVRRATALHDRMLADDAVRVQRLLLSWRRPAYPGNRDS